jgi:cytochrome P450
VGSGTFDFVADLGAQMPMRVISMLMGIPLDEVLKRFPEWEVDYGGAKLAPTSTVRGWETLPAFTGRSA